MADKFDSFTERARKVLTLAREEAQRFNHDYIGTEHILLGLVREGDGVAARVLSNLGVQLPGARSTVEAIIGRGEGMVAGEIGLTPRAKKVIELAVDEARRLNHHYIGTEHLLLGLVREGEGIAAGVLESLGVSLEKVHTQVMQVVNQSGGYGLSGARGTPAPPRSGEPRRQEVPMAGDKFDRFTERARTVMTLAQEEAQRFNHNYIGTEHLLLALVREGDGVAARVLKNLGVQLPKVRSAVEFIIGRGEGLVVGEVGLTPRAKKVIELSIEEARRLNHHYIGTEHILLGLVREGEGIAAGVLESLGVGLEKVRRQVMQVVNQSGGYGLSERPSLGALRRAIAVGQAQEQEGIEVSLLALELYTGGFVATVRLRCPNRLTYAGLDWDMRITARDDQGTVYQGHTNAEDWRSDPEWRITAAFAPAPTAPVLYLEVAKLRWREPDDEGQPMKGAERTAGPWTFTVALPAAEDE